MLHWKMRRLSPIDALNALKPQANRVIEGRGLKKLCQQQAPPVVVLPHRRSSRPSIIHQQKRHHSPAKLPVFVTQTSTSTTTNPPPTSSTTTSRFASTTKSPFPQNPPCCLLAATIRFPKPSGVSSAMASAYSALHGTAAASNFTITALGRWSVLSSTLPAVDKINALHVYDFDNTCE